MSTVDNCDIPQSSGAPRKSRDYTLTRVRNNQRRCRERRRQYITDLEQKVEATERALAEALAEIAALRSELDQRISAGDISTISSREQGLHDQNGNPQEPLVVLPGGDQNLSPSRLGTTDAVSPNQPIYLETTEDSNVVTSLTLQSPSPKLCHSCAAPNQYQSAAANNDPRPTIESATTPTIQSPRLLNPTPTSAALQLQDSSLLQSALCGYAAPDNESTTPCSQAYVFISQLNFKGLDVSVIEQWLHRGFRQARDPEEGCRVENNLLFQLLDFISDGVVYSLIIINKAGGLIYNREFQSGLVKLSTNDYLVLAGTFHGIHAITRSLTPLLPTSAPPSTPTHTSSSSTPTIPTTTTTQPSPASPLHIPSPAAATTLPNPTQPKTGLEVLETEKFRLTCFQTATGTKFLLFTDPLMAGVDVVMRKVYELYADYVMKNPFYQIEMPVRCEAFDRNLGGWVKGRV
ncbi:hypothetical protein FQN55_004375 [Onygenales sp. PD_40]|nr:hypothetical protein FQN55_004375 [Onygenales sp. PD_40]